MKHVSVNVLGFFCLTALLVGNSVAADIDKLARVSVGMDRSTVRKLLGQPQAESHLSIGLEADMYAVKGLAPLVATGCVYSYWDRLVGQAFLFKGSSAMDVVDKLEKIGFTRVQEKPGGFLLSGKDDDTGQAIVVSVSQSKGFTTVATFEETFYRKY